MVRGFLYVVAVLVCTATWCSVWNIFFIFGPLLVRRDFFVPLALLFIVLLIFFCICAKYCFWIVPWFLPLSFEFFWVPRFFCTYRKIWFRIYFPVRGRGIICGVWWRTMFESYWYCSLRCDLKSSEGVTISSAVEWRRYRKYVKKITVRLTIK